ncbi:MAG: amidohydrolase [Actinomycetes bacterium]
MAVEPNTTIWTDARVFTGDRSRPWADAVAFAGDRVVAVGSLRKVKAAAGRDASQESLGGALVAPGFIDGHFHTLSTGEAQGRVDLVHAKTLDEIQTLVAKHAAARPNDRWVLGKSWLFDAVPGGRPTAAMLDAVVPDRPVVLDANDYHSAWVNTAALLELGIKADSPDPVGGRIDRDPDTGVATGFLEENAAGVYAWDHLERITTDQTRLDHLRASIAACNAAGLTGVIDMAMRDGDLLAMQAAQEHGWLDLRVVGHWVMDRDGRPQDHLDRVAHVAEIASRNPTARLRIAGIKLWVDGVIDGCTAAVNEPYVNGALPEPQWDADALDPVVAAADAAGLQVAMHAIGDRAVQLALDAVEKAQRANGRRPGQLRHRIEHIEYARPEELSRFAQLGVTASMQPVHADPAIAENWYAMLGDPRASMGFRWSDLVNSGARLVFGTDAPTAPYQPLPNLYIAATRRSALNPSVAEGRGADQVRPLDAAFAHATADAAWSCFEEEARGRIAQGLLADLVVISPEVFSQPADALLTAQVQRTLVGGREVFRAG